MTNYRSPALNRLERLNVFPDTHSALDAYTMLSNLKSGAVESHFVGGRKYTYYDRKAFLLNHCGVTEDNAKMAMNGLEKEIIRAISS